LRQRLSRSLAAAVVLGALAIAGCGGDDESSTATTTATGGPLSKEQFLARGNAICRTGTYEIDQAADQTFAGRRRTDAQLQRFADLAVPAVPAQIDGIRALTPPEGDEDQVDEILDAAQEANDRVEADPSLFAAGQGGDDPFAHANELAAEYGLTECGS
jgi:hypothetical protein